MTSTFQRQPLAVMFTDIKGYTSLTSRDEMLALSLVDKKRSILQPLLKKHKGTFVKEMGDGTVTYFKDPTQATDCAIKLQEQVYDDKDLNIRIGIHYGDTIIKNKDVFGDTVNIASRIESLGIPGGVFISKEARDQIKKPHDDVSLGLQTMKGVGRLIEVYGLKGKQLSTPNPKDYEVNKVSVHSDKDVPSIAILPFENKGKSEDDFYAYGIISDLITDVTSAGRIRVASLKDIEKLEYNKLDNAKLAQRLFVRYVAQGSLWRKEDTFQLSIELYDTKKNRIIWSDNWYESWAELPTIKVNLSEGLLKTLDSNIINKNNIDTTNVEAYDFYLRAKYKYEKRKNTEDTEIARGLLNKATDLDNNLIAAKVLLGTTFREMSNYDMAMKIYTLALKQAEVIGNKHGMGQSLNNIGNVYCCKGDYDKALDYFGRTFRICEEIENKYGMGHSLNNIGTVYYYKGDYDKALEHFDRSKKIKQEMNDKSGIGDSLNNIGTVYKDRGNDEEALDNYERSLKQAEVIGNKHGMGQSLNNIGIIYKEKGDYAKAVDYYERSLQIKEELGDKRAIAISLFNIGNVYHNKGEIDKALDSFNQAFNIFDKLGDKSGMGASLHSIGNVYKDRGNDKKALEYYKRSLKIDQGLGKKSGMGHSLQSIGTIYKEKGDYEKAVNYLEKALDITKGIGLKEGDLMLEITTHLFLTYKALGKAYDVNEIHNLIKETKNIEFSLNYSLYQLLEDTSYLKTAYTQLQEKTDIMEQDLKNKFIGYLIPKAIIEEYEKLNK